MSKTYCKYKSHRYGYITDDEAEAVFEAKYLGPDDELYEYGYVQEEAEWWWECVCIDDILSMSQEPVLDHWSNHLPSGWTPEDMNRLQLNWNCHKSWCALQYSFIHELNRQIDAEDGVAYTYDPISYRKYTRDVYEHVMADDYDDIFDQWDAEYFEEQAWHEFFDYNPIEQAVIDKVKQKFQQARNAVVHFNFSSCGNGKPIELAKPKSFVDVFGYTLQSTMSDHDSDEHLPKREAMKHRFKDRSLKEQRKHYTCEQFWATSAYKHVERLMLKHVGQHVNVALKAIKERGLMEQWNSYESASRRYVNYHGAHDGPWKPGRAYVNEDGIICAS